MVIISGGRVRIYGLVSDKQLLFVWGCYLKVGFVMRKHWISILGNILEVIDVGRLCHFPQPDGEISDDWYCEVQFASTRLPIAHTYNTVGRGIRLVECSFRQPDYEGLVEYICARIE